MSGPRRKPSPRAAPTRRRSPRPIGVAIVALLRASHPPSGPGDDVWVCAAPATADAIARVAARRAGSIEGLRAHPIHGATEQAIRVPADVAAQWRRDAWQAARQGLISTTDALALSAQIDPPDIA